MLVGLLAVCRRSVFVGGAHSYCMKRTRRELLAGIGVGSAALAGCVAPTQSGRQRPDSQYTQVYDAVVPAVVVVRVAENGRQVGQGSGFAIDSQAIVTNHHVVAPGSDVSVQFADHEWAEATVVGSDIHSDLAVIELTGSATVAESLSFVSEVPPVGEEILAIGAPFDLTDSLSRGVISGRERSVPALGNYDIPDAIQTDAALNPGSSGGPIVNLDGEVVGVVFAGQGETVGFAISAALAQRVVPELREHGEYAHSHLGVTVLDVSPEIADTNDLADPRGVLVVETVADGPADGVLEESDVPESPSEISDPAEATPEPGEEPEEPPAADTDDLPTGGDVIVDIGGTPIADADGLSRTLALETRPGETVPITVLRDGTETVIDVTLGVRPSPDE